MSSLVFTLTEKYAIVNLLTMMMEADTVIHPKEVEYMDDVLADFELTAIDFDHMENMDLQMCLSIVEGMSLEKRLEVKKMLSKMAEVDGFVDPREMKFWSSICNRDSLCHQ